MRILVACEESQAVTKEFRRLGHEAYSCDVEPCSGGHPEWHLQQDVSKLLDGMFSLSNGKFNKKPWDMLIAFPPCTHLAVSGARYFKQKQEDGRQQAAIDFFMLLANAPIGKVSVENPVGIMSTKWRKPDQIIQPWQFGHPESKKTCLWLKNLPALTPTGICPPKGYSLVKSAIECNSCPDCGEPYCDGCQEHYADCNCVGPTQSEEYDFRYIDGFMFAQPKGNNLRPLWENQTPSGQNKLGPSADRAKLRSKTYEGIARAMAEQWGCL